MTSISAENLEEVRVGVGRTCPPRLAATSPQPTPRPEYPRPDRDRSDRWLSLNGTWELDLPEATVPVVVPFAWETAASGVARTWLEHATYRRTVAVPAAWTGSRVALCFGAVHYRARVLVDGVPLVEHIGGHTPFDVDVTDMLAPGVAGVIEVEVDAPADKRSIPHGKQRSIPRDDYDGVSFTPTSGIWQSVWLEARGRTYAETVTVRGDSLTGFDLTVRLAGDDPTGTTVRVESDDASEGIELVTDAHGVAVGRLELTAPRLWSPADPHVYTLVVRAADDVVRVTGGLRRIETCGEELRLNGERLYLRGVLDQGYWPGSGLTAPDEQALVADLTLARELGYTLVRKHIKLEDPRWLDAADRLGLLVWAEPPAPSRFSPEATAAFEAQLAPMVARDGNHPSVAIWGLYNEEWGLDWDIPGSASRAAAAAHAYDTLHALDATRPIVENSGWSHVRSDLVDWHYYDESPVSWAQVIAELATGGREDFPVKLGPDFVVDKSFYGSASFPRTGLPLLNSEYGGGFTSLERAWHLRWQTQELRRQNRFAGYVYTELVDVEHEAAGLRDINRQAKDLGGLDPRDVNADTVLVLDVTPACAGADVPVPDGPWALDVHVSHHGSTPVWGWVQAAWVAAGTPPRVGETAVLDVAQAQSAVVVAEPYVLSAAVRLNVPPPGDVAAARLLVWLVDATDGQIRARTFVDAGPIEEPNRRGERPA